MGYDMVVEDVVKGHFERSPQPLRSQGIDPKPGSKERPKRPENRASML
jgi:hypothetical protein